jgi:hypothetical protein
MLGEPGLPLQEHPDAAQQPTGNRVLLAATMQGKGQGAAHQPQTQDANP